MIEGETGLPAAPPPKAPDDILGELWGIKRELNRAAGYRIDELARMAHDAADQERRRWLQERTRVANKTSTSQLGSPLEDESQGHASKR
jgi:hypothetical protein